MADAKTGLTVFLIRDDQVAKFETAVAGWGETPIALAPPLHGFFLPLPSAPSQPPWVAGVRSVLKTPTALTLHAQSPAGVDTSIERDMLVWSHVGVG
jgi:hypothetical protein